MNLAHVCTCPKSLSPILHGNPLELGDAFELFEEVGGGLVAVFGALGEHFEDDAFELVGPGEEDYDNNKILTSSPIGQGLLGKKRGDVAEVQAPMGKLRFEIVDISLP